MAGDGTRAVGRRAEASALEFLRANGLSLLERNFHCRFGEIDLVMTDGDCLVFIEVRQRRRNTFARAAHTVGREKQRKLMLAASLYVAMRTTGAPPTCRFDVIGIDTQGQSSRIDWRRNAFQSE